MPSKNHAVPNRWFIAIMGTMLQICLGTVYAWSFFQKPLMSTFGWSNSQVAWTFSTAIGFLGLSAAWGGVNLARIGPVRMATTGGILYGAGYLIGAVALSIKSLPLLYAGFGVIGGIGLGLGYVTPVATVAKWFPEKKGLVTGMVIMGFGFGALFMSRLIGPGLMAAFNNDIVPVFCLIGVGLLAGTIPAARSLRNPPPGFLPTGNQPPATTAGAEQQISARECICSRRFALMWIIFFCNICSGIMFIGFQSPMLQDLLKNVSPTMNAAALAGAGATLIAISSLFNGIGRLFWGGVSDKLGRVQVFRLLIGSQILVFTALMFVKNPLLFGVLVCYVLLCYGGGFGSMPSFVLDVFGAKNMPVVYGAILTAWSAGGIAGPQIVAIIKDANAVSAAPYTFGIGALLLTAGFVVSLFLSNKKLVPTASSSTQQ